jgi:AsmA family protein
MRLRIVILVVLGVLAVVVVGAAAALWLGGGPLIAWAIENPVSGAMNRKIAIDGSLTVDWGRNVTIAAQDVSVANTSWGSDPVMFSARTLKLSFDLFSLVSGPVHVGYIELDGWKLRLETSKSGKPNWNFAASATVPSHRTQFPVLDRLTARNGSLVYRNGETEATSALEIAGLDFVAPGPTQLVKFDGSGAFQGMKLQIAGTAGPVAELRDPSKPYPLKIEAQLDENHVSVDGTAKDPLDFAGIDVRFSANGPDLQGLGHAVGVPLPKFPPFRGTSELVGGNGEWSLNALSLRIGNSDVEGGLAINTKVKVPSIKAKLTSSAIDLSDFKGLYGGRPETPPPTASASGDVIPNQPIAVHKLPDVDADLTFYGTRIKSPGGLPLDAVALRLRLKGGELSIDPLRFHAASGDFALQLQYNPFTHKTPPQLNVKLDIRHIQLHPLLQGMGLPPFVAATSGIVGGGGTIETTGTSLKDFVSRMNGNAAIFLEDGQMSDLLQKLIPIDAAKALGTYISGDKIVPIDCLIARFDIDSGVAKPSTFVFNTPDTSVVGSGSIDFGKEVIDLTLKPYNRKFTLVSLRTPIEIKGKLRKPDFHIDTHSIIQRIGESLGLGVIFPPAAVLPLVDKGLGGQNRCSKFFSPASQQAPNGSGNENEAQAPAPSHDDSTPPHP